VTGMPCEVLENCVCRSDFCKIPGGNGGGPEPNLINLKSSALNIHLCGA